VPLGTVRPHVLELVALGWTYTQIGERAQVAPTAVARIAAHGRAVDDVRRHVATAILAVPLVSPSRLRRHDLDRELLERARAIVAGEWTPQREPAAYAVGEEWRADAACADVDPEAMFPQRGDSIAAIRALCDVCPAQIECQEAGLRERHGVWGGVAERHRRALRRMRGIFDDESEVA
jgi:hypothetical protein